VLPSYRQTSGQTARVLTPRSETSRPHQPVSFESKNIEKNLNNTVNVATG